MLSGGDVLSQEEEVSQDGLGNEDGGDTKGELSFLRFVPEEVHPQECADAASCDRHPDEGRLRYAPLPSAGLPFVDSEDKEGQDIDADEIYDDCSQDHLAVTPINTNLLVLCFRFNGLHNLEYSPYDKDRKRDEKDHAEPIHRSMERLYE